MRYFLSENRSNFKQTYQAGLASQIYVPLNSGSYVGPDNQSSIFKNRPSTDSIKLVDWIANQIALGNITVSPSGADWLNYESVGASDHIYRSADTDNGWFRIHDYGIKDTGLEDPIGIEMLHTATQRIVAVGDVENEYSQTQIRVEDHNQLVWLGDRNSHYIEVDSSVTAGVKLGDPDYNNNGTSIIIADSTETITLQSQDGTLTLDIPNLPTYADDAAAGAGGLTAGHVYKTATGELRIKI